MSLRDRYSSILLEYCPFEIYVDIDLDYRRKQPLILKTTFWRNVFKLLSSGGYVHVCHLNKFLAQRIYKVRNVPYAKSFADNLSDILNNRNVVAKVQGNDIIFFDDIVIDDHRTT